MIRLNFNVGAPRFGTVSQELKALGEKFDEATNPRYRLLRKLDAVSAKLNQDFGSNPLSAPPERLAEQQQAEAALLQLIKRSHPREVRKILKDLSELQNYHATPDSSIGKAITWKLSGTAIF